MPDFFHVSTALSGIYHERNFAPGFWAEPFNALTNIAFLLAAGMAWVFSIKRDAKDASTSVLLLIAGAIGFGSFLFHTVPNHFTMWLDIIPISSFQIIFLWLVARQMLSLSRFAAASVVAIVVGSSFALFPLHVPLNGSLFYIPPFLAMLAIGFYWLKTSDQEPFLLVGAATCFALAVVARTVDWMVTWPIGSHFIWHLLVAFVVYLSLRGWIIFRSSTTANSLREPVPSQIRASLVSTAQPSDSHVAP